MKSKSTKSNSTIIGIDEAGRGPLAGPVAVGAFAVKSKMVLRKFRGVKDSKQLSEKQRESWFAFIQSERALQHPAECVSRPRPLRHFAERALAERDEGLAERMCRRGRGRSSHASVVSFSSAKTIDRKGIVHAIHSALTRCLNKLEKQGFANEGSIVLLDGSLKAPVKFKKQKTIIDGDAKEPVIALASICAKVLRDRRMKRVGKKYPKYGFEIHKGYGTLAHYKALNENGPCDEHRLTFL